MTQGRTRKVCPFAAALKNAVTAAALSLTLLALPLPLAGHAVLAQGWADDGWDGPPPRFARNGLEVYPDDFSDEDIEAARRASPYARRYEPWPYQPRGFEARRPWEGDDNADDAADDDDRDDRDDGAGIDSTGIERLDDAGRTPPLRFADPAEDGSAASATAEDFASGPRPLIRPMAPPIVPFAAAYPPGSIVIDTGGRKLYYVRGNRSAFAYPIGVGREGFAWTGLEKVSRVSDWPDWYPPAEMRKRQPQLPEKMLGGLNNPLGAKAIYLGATLYRIHGTNDPASIGKAASSGCFRMMNGHVVHLASLVGVGTQVAVVRSLGRGLKIVSAPPPATSADEMREPRRPPQIRWRSAPYDDRYDY